MDEAMLTALIADQRRDLAATLGALRPDQWHAPSLCEGWRVRDVVAHIVMPFRYSTGKFILEMVRARGKFNVMAMRCARRDADELSTGELVDALADNVNHAWKPPGGGLAGALSHDVIHGLDITVALGLDQPVPDQRIRAVLDSTKPRSIRYFGADLTGVQLRADDLDWTYGSGEPLTGSAQDLLLVLCGRTLPPGHLTGEPRSRFSRQ
ncbi:MAG: maleylpyruvate isomerase family mycothiol-dependent enzyme [Nocardia sp.]|nr:maleylpyruvate isomerase family mycothiol-dependent enzyme [Nocardia sp.]